MSYLFRVVSRAMCIVLLGAVSGKLFAQAPALSWSHCFGGTRDDQANGVSATSDGGVIVVGETSSTDGDIVSQKGSSSMYVIKLAASGSVDWQNEFGGPKGYTTGFAVKQTRDGGYAIIGRTSAVGGDVTTSLGSDDVWFLKLTSTGTIQWQKTFGGTDNELGLGIDTVYDGGYYICGSIKSTDGNGVGNHGDWDAFVMRLDSTGTIKWNSVYGGARYEYAAGVTATSDSGCIMVGEANSFDVVHGYHGGNGTDIWVVKYNKNGAVQWDSCYGGTLDDYGTSICELPGGYVLTSYATSSDGDMTDHHGTSRYDMWTAKISKVGKIVWKKSLGSSGDDGGFSIRKSYQGRLYIGGYIGAADGDVSLDKGGVDFALAQLDTAGNLDWIKTAGGTGTEFAYGAVQTKDSGFVCAGYATSADGDVTGLHGSGWGDIWVTKFGGAANNCGATASVGIDVGRHIYCGTNVDTFIIVSNTGAASMTVDSGATPVNWQFLTTMPQVVAAGKSDSIHIRFLPKQIGTVVLDSVVLVVRTCNIRLVTALTARLDTITWSLPASVDAGSVVTCGAEVDTIMVIANTSPAAITVDSNGTMTNWKIKSPMPRHIAAGALDTIVLQFLPLQIGVATHDTIAFVAQPCGVRRLTMFSGRMDTISFAPPPPLTLAGVPLCRLPLDTFVVVQNSSRAPLVINALSLPHSFQVLSPLPDTIGAGKADTVAVRFDATGGLMIVDTLVISVGPCNTQVVIQLSGRADSVLAVTPSVHFGTFSTPHTQCDSIVIRNLSSSTVHLASLKLPHNVTLQSGTVPADIPAGQALTFDVCFGPDSTYSIDGSAFATFDVPCNVTISVPMTGHVQKLLDVNSGMVVGSMDLGPNYPEPFGDHTTLQVTLPAGTGRGAQLRVFDLFGREVANLGSQLNGNSVVVLSADNLVPGTYMVVLEAAGRAIVRPLHVIR